MRSQQHSCHHLPRGQLPQSPTHPTPPTFSDGSFWKLFAIKKSPGEGHSLFFYYISYSVKNQLSMQNTCDFNEIIELICIKTTSNIDLLTYPCAGDACSFVITNEYVYIYEKMYNTLYGDILPLVFLQYTIWNLFYPSLLVFMISVKMCIWQFWQVFTCASIWRPYHRITVTEKNMSTLRWRHNDHAGVSNHQPHGCLLNRLFRR